MKKALFLIIFMILYAPLALGEEVKDVLGWRQARWGMSEDEVLRAFKGEAVRRTEAELGKEEKNPHWPVYWPIVIKNINITSLYHNSNYDIYFVFDKKNKSLIAINIEKPGASYIDKPSKEKSYVSNSHFNELEALLINKYGMYTNINEDHSIVGKTTVAIWVFNSTIIKLSFTDGGGGTKKSYLEVSYHKRNPSDSDYL
jgi:hypothetical protein